MPTERSISELSIKELNERIVAEREIIKEKQSAIVAQLESQIKVNENIIDYNTSKINGLLDKISRKKQAKVSLDSPDIARDVKRHLGWRDKARFRKYAKRLRKNGAIIERETAKIADALEKSTQENLDRIGLYEEAIEKHPDTLAVYAENARQKNQENCIKLLQDPEEYLKQQFASLVTQFASEQVTSQQLQDRIASNKEVFKLIQADQYTPEFVDGLKKYVQALQGQVGMNNYYIEGNEDEIRILEMTKQTNNPQLPILKSDTIRRNAENEALQLLIDNISPAVALSEKAIIQNSAEATKGLETPGMPTVQEEKPQVKKNSNSATMASASSAAKEQDSRKRPVILKGPTRVQQMVKEYEEKEMSMRNGNRTRTRPKNN